MRAWMVAGLLGGSILGGVALVAPVPGVAPARAAGILADAQQPAQQGLCRRAVRPAPLPPEPKVEQQKQPRWESRDRGAVALEAPPAPMPPPPAPPPPPPPPPPPMAVPVAPSAVDADGGGARAASGGETAKASRAPAPGVVAPAPRLGFDGSSSFAPRQPQIRAGLLTAGDHDDLLNPELYAAYVDGFLKSESLQGVPRVDTSRVLTVAVKDRQGRAVPFAPVTLTCADGNTLTLSTLADGTAVFFPGLDRLGASVKIGAPGAAARSVAIADAGSQVQTLTVGGGAGAVKRFDLALVIDTTGSMGDEIEYLKTELKAIIDRLSARHQGLDIRLALIPYRDQGDDYVTRTYPFTGRIDSIQSSLRQHFAGGGGDYPEAMEVAMGRAVALDWRPDAVKSLLLVADAPPHAEDVAKTWEAAEWARARRIQIVPVAASGVGDGAEYIMRAMAASTQSRYLFLTDDSGIGNPHAPPAIDCYLVTKLDALIGRVLDSQISGRRVEPEKQEVIRSVGQYDGGRCILPPDFGKAQD
ncbi:vWA domain-containing protein [Sphingomonas canadensis]|uniref:VWA domain-containing protein n=1 Tax=Sphingomonas canadensis TaxID=1219257 RepID=A0ABW3H1Y1_9SPHN|nr:vWA domain-containing protein [Sphingomonas canadensis]MCW3835365.1 VWA domain-containing protein [Sphingomonas canadensis]